MIRKFHEAKLNGNVPVELWGTGSPMREFLHVDDLSQAVIFALENKLEEHLYNIGTGKDISIKSLGEIIQKITGHNGDIVWDTTKPDGTPRKLLDISRYTKETKWRPLIDLEIGISETYKKFRLGE
jgi:GDP-L-fucose synthase